jgi:hypothetical protein
MVYLVPDARRKSTVLGDLADRMALRPWSVVLVIVGACLIALDIWFLATARTKPGVWYLGDFEEIQPLTWIVPAIFVSGPSCVLIALYRLWAVRPAWWFALVAAVPATCAAVLIVFMAAFLMRPPLSRMTPAGEGFSLSGDTEHQRAAGNPAIAFSSDLTTVTVRSRRCGQWEATLSLTSHSDAMSFGPFRRVDKNACTPTPAMSTVLQHLATVRSWQVLNADEHLIELHGDTVFRLLD